MPLDLTAGCDQPPLQVVEIARHIHQRHPGMEAAVETRRQLVIGARTKLGDHPSLRRQLAAGRQRTDDYGGREPYASIGIGGERCELPQ
jgi:ElaB/YqjD/DUF883 family membrane-anchored ribosome-binding protein